MSFFHSISFSLIYLATLRLINLFSTIRTTHIDCNCLSVSTLYRSSKCSFPSLFAHNPFPLPGSKLCLLLQLSTIHFTVFIFKQLSIFTLIQIHNPSKLLIFLHFTLKYTLFNSFLFLIIIFYTSFIHSLILFS